MRVGQISNRHVRISRQLVIEFVQRRNGRLRSAVSIEEEEELRTTGARASHRFACHNPATAEEARVGHPMRAEFLPAAKKDKMEKFGGREKLQERLTAIKQILEGQ